MWALAKCVPRGRDCAILPLTSGLHEKETPTPFCYGWTIWSPSKLSPQKNSVQLLSSKWNTTLSLRGQVSGFDLEFFLGRCKGIREGEGEPWEFSLHFNAQVLPLGDWCHWCIPHRHPLCALHVVLLCAFHSGFDPLMLPSVLDLQSF